MVAWAWIGGYIFDGCFPRGWQSEWYGMPSMATYAVILMLHVGASCAWAKELDSRKSGATASDARSDLTTSGVSDEGSTDGSSGDTESK
jgi:hypothetical protein